MDRAINIFAVKLTIFYLTGEVLRVVFPRIPWCKFATNSAALIVALFLPASDLFHAER